MLMPSKPRETDGTSASKPVSQQVTAQQALKSPSKAPGTGRKSDNQANSRRRSNYSLLYLNGKYTPPSGKSEGTAHNGYSVYSPNKRTASPNVQSSPKGPLRATVLSQVEREIGKAKEKLAAGMLRANASNSPELVAEKKKDAISQEASVASRNVPTIQSILRAFDLHVESSAKQGTSGTQTHVVPTPLDQTSNRSDRMQLPDQFVTDAAHGRLLAVNSFQFLHQASHATSEFSQPTLVQQIDYTQSANDLTDPDTVKQRPKLSDLPKQNDRKSFYSNSAFDIGEAPGYTEGSALLHAATFNFPNELFEDTHEKDNTNQAVSFKGKDSPDVKETSHVKGAVEVITIAQGISPDVVSETEMMSFWSLLQQTYLNLEEMLVDLEAARLELDLANARTTAAEKKADSLQVQLEYAQSKFDVAAAKLKDSEIRESVMQQRLFTAMHTNAELICRLEAAEQKTASLQLKLERSSVEPEVSKASDVRCTSSVDLQLAQLKDEMATADTTRLKAELDVAVLRSQLLTAQQETSVALSRATRFEQQAQELAGEVAKLKAHVQVAETDSKRLSDEVSTLREKVANKEARLLRSSQWFLKTSADVRKSLSILCSKQFRQQELATQDGLQSTVTVVARASTGTTGRGDDSKALFKQLLQQQSQQHEMQTSRAGLSSREESYQHPVSSSRTSNVGSKQEYHIRNAGVGGVSTDGPQAGNATSLPEDDGYRARMLCFKEKFLQVQAAQQEQGGQDAEHPRCIASIQTWSSGDDVAESSAGSNDEAVEKALPPLQEDCFSAEFPLLSSATTLQQAHNFKTNGSSSAKHRSSVSDPLRLFSLDGASEHSDTRKSLTALLKPRLIWAGNSTHGRLPRQCTDLASYQASSVGGSLVESVDGNSPTFLTSSARFSSLRPDVRYRRSLDAVRSSSCASWYRDSQGFQRAHSISHTAGFLGSLLAVAVAVFSVATAADRHLRKARTPGQVSNHSCPLDADLWPDMKVYRVHVPVEAHWE